MNVADRYRLSRYQDLGALDQKENIRLKRNEMNGNICVEKHVSPGLKDIYEFLKKHTGDAIPRIYEIVCDEQELIIIEEYIEGRTLEDMLREKSFDEGEAVDILLQLCDALKILHHAEPMIVCRDLKAENIMMDKNGRLKIIDFDIARTFQKGKNRDTVLLGTKEYAAPEQFGYFQTDNRTDIYAAGVLLNYLVLKKFPVEQVASGLLGNVVRKCTNLSPEQRYQSVEELEDELWEACQSKEYIAGNTGTYTLPGFRSRTPWKMVIAVLGYMFLLWLCFTMEISKDHVPLTGVTLWFERLMIWCSQMAFVGVCCNYRGWAKRIPWVRSGRRWKRICGYIFIYIAFFVLSACICAIYETLF